jgi:alpha-galactosidase
MPIHFDITRKLFHLNNDKLSYIFFINEKDVLQHLYFGRKIEDIDILSSTNLGWDWSKTYIDKDTQTEKATIGNYYRDHSMFEIPSHGIADKRGAMIIIAHQDGTTNTFLTYLSHRIYSGKPNLKDLPHTYLNSDDEADSLEIILKDFAGEIYVKHTFTIFNRQNIIARNTTIVNKEESEIIVKRAYSLSLDLPKSEYDLYHFHGDWNSERQIAKERLNDALRRISSNMGRSSHEENPFVILADHSADEQQGEAIGISFVYSGNFSIDVNVDKWKSTRVMIGINDEDFAFHLAKNQEFVTPEAILAYSDEGIGGLSRTLHDLIRENLIPKRYASAKRPVLLNSWEGCYLDFNTRVILGYIDMCKQIKVDLFVLDDGWFGKRDFDDRSLGDWVVNKKKINLEKIIEKCKQNEMKFGLWFEPEMVNPDSNFYRSHPEFALGLTNTDRSLSRHQLALDMVNKNVIDHVFKQMCKILDKYDIDYVKWDHNRNIFDIYSPMLNGKRHGETYHRMMLGSYKLMDKIVNKYPNILFESCASGGGRFDLGMLYYMPQTWTSDETSPIQRLFIQHSTSMIYPLSTMGAHIAKWKVASYKTKAEVALFGTYGFEIDPRKLSADEIREVNKITDIYNKYHNNVIQNGDLYRLRSPYEGNAMSMISISKDKSQALFLYVNILKENNRYRFIKLRGLDSKRRYHNTLDGKVHLGEYYARIGLNLCWWRNESESNLVILEAVDES